MVLYREVTHGIPVFTKDGQRVGDSKPAAVQAITQVVMSRIFMATPGMREFLFMINFILVQISHRLMSLAKKKDIA